MAFSIRKPNLLTISNRHSRLMSHERWDIGFRYRVFMYLCVILGLLVVHFIVVSSFLFLSFSDAIYSNVCMWAGECERFVSVAT